MQKITSRLPSKDIKNLLGTNKALSRKRLEIQYPFEITLNGNFEQNNERIKQLFTKFEQGWVFKTVLFSIKKEAKQFDFSSVVLPAGVTKITIVTELNEEIAPLFKLSDDIKIEVGEAAGGFFEIIDGVRKLEFITFAPGNLMLPDSIEHLILGDEHGDLTVSRIPSKLKILDFAIYNNDWDLELPETLEILKFGSSQIEYWNVALPNSLKVIDFDTSAVTFPSGFVWPENLEILRLNYFADHQHSTTLPPLPPKLKELRESYISNGAYPDSLENLYIIEGDLYTDTLPKNLRHLDCDVLIFNAPIRDGIISLKAWGIETDYYDGKNIPMLPNTLKSLNIGHFTIPQGEEEIIKQQKDKPNYLPEYLEFLEFGSKAFAGVVLPDGIKEMVIKNYDTGIAFPVNIPKSLQKLTLDGHGKKVTFTAPFIGGYPAIEKSHARITGTRV